MYIKPITVVGILLLLLGGCMSNSDSNDPVPTARNRRIDNLHTGDLAYKEEYNPDKFIMMDDPNQVVFYNVDVLLEKGSMAVRLMAPDYSVFKSFNALSGGRIVFSERLPPHLGQWELNVRGKGVEGLVTIGFTIHD